MLINTITNRYIFKEMLGPFSINLLVFIFLFLITQTIEIVNWIVNYNINLLTVLKIIFFSLPWFLMFIIPMSTMMAILLTFLRLSDDNEIVALKSCGLGIYRLLPPVLLLAAFGCLFTAFITLYGIPKTKKHLEDLALTLASSNIDIAIKERTFNDEFKDVMLYVNKIDVHSKKLIDVFIEDKRKPDIVSTVVAPEGRLFNEADKFTVHLLLSDGTIHQTNLKERSATFIKFDTYQLSFDLKKEVDQMEKREKSREEMSLTELRHLVKDSEVKDKDYYRARIVLQRRFAIPVACLTMGLLAFPLGIQSKTTKRSFGIILCLFFFLMYYVLLTAGYSFGEDGTIAPEIGIWIPNVVMGGIGLFFLIQTARERSLKMDLIARRIQRFFARLFRTKQNS